MFEGSIFSYFYLEVGDVCTGSTIALKIIQTTIAAMIKCFEWNVVGVEAYKSITPDNIEEGNGISLSRVHPLICVPVARLNPFLSIWWYV